MKKHLAVHDAPPRQHPCCRSAPLTLRLPLAARDLRVLSGAARRSLTISTRLRRFLSSRALSVARTFIDSRVARRWRARAYNGALSRPLALFAGIWTRWRSVRKVKEGATTNDLFAFLTTEPNAIAAPIHAKAVPVILTSPAEVDRWLEAETADARFGAERPLPDDALRIVAKGEKKDRGES